MRQHIPVLVLSVLATSAISANQLITLDGKVAVAAKDAHAVAQTDAAIGDLVAATVIGAPIVTAAADITAGTRVQVGANGQATPHTTGVPVGIASESAVAGEEVQIVFASLGQAYTPPA